MYRPYNRGEAGSILQASAPSNREGGYIGTQRLVQSLQQSSWQYGGGNSPFLAKLQFSKFGSNSRESVCYICVWTGVGCTIGRRVDINCRVFRLAVRGE